MASRFPSVPSTDPPIDPASVWVFGYGSLMWRPGFDFVDQRKAQLDGFSRDMCLTSIHYRGTADKPGMVCGLSPGGACHGVAFRIALERANAVIDYLDERELISYIYVPRHLPIVVDGVGSVIARVYVPDSTHAQFAGRWPADKKAKHIAQGIGSEGSSLDYVANIVAHLRQLGITDANLESLLALARTKK